MQCHSQILTQILRVSLFNGVVIYPLLSECTQSKSGSNLTSLSNSCNTPFDTSVYKAFLPPKNRNYENVSPHSKFGLSFLKGRVHSLYLQSNAMTSYMYTHINPVLMNKFLELRENLSEHSHGWNR